MPAGFKRNMAIPSISRPAKSILDRVFTSLVPPSGGTRFPALDGLRGIAAVAVMLYHCPIAKETWLGGYGSVAVTIFFTLSAFLLYYPWAAGKRPRLADYYRRRFWRIYPGWCCALALAVLVGWIIGQPATVRDVLLHLSFLYSWDPVHLESLISPAWSLAAEVQFYLLLPLLVYLLRDNFRLGFASLFAFVLATAALFFVLPVGVRLAIGNNLPILLMPFLIGILAAKLTACQRVRMPVLLAIIGLLGLLAVGYWPRSTAPTLLRLIFGSPRGIANCIFAGMVILGLTQLNPVAAFFSRRPLRLLGIAGYGIFLLHAPVMLLIQHFWGDLCTLIIGLPLAIIIGILSYLYIEAPAMKWGKQLFNTKTQRHEERQIIKQRRLCAFVKRFLGDLES